VKSSTPCTSRHGYFIGIDSDGCVFPTMEKKHRDCFLFAFLQEFGLEAQAAHIWDIWEHVFLFSLLRGTNRYIGLVRVLELMQMEGLAFDYRMLESLSEWTASGSLLCLNELTAWCKTPRSRNLQRVLRWSISVNELIRTNLGCMPAYPEAAEALEAMRQFADVMVISQTPREALMREWHEAGIDSAVCRIAGQEYGSKARQLQQAAGGNYPELCSLMVGDAPGDLEAARDAGLLFFPIIPGEEQASWKELLDEGLPRFQEGTFFGEYEQQCIDTFLENLKQSRP